MSEIVLKNVRLSYPNLFKAKAIQKDQEPKFSANFILDKKTDAAQIETLRKLIQTVAEEKWGKTKIPKFKHALLRDGADREDKEGYGPEVMFIGASSQKRFPVVDRDPSIELNEQDGKPYAGCYVNASLRLWAYDNEFGKGVSATLRAVQFVKDGEAFGDAPVKADKVFSTLPDEDVLN